MFQGSIVALITPFKNGGVDEAAFRSFVEWQINEGTEGLVPCGTTGESPTLDHEEHMRVTEICIDVAKGRVPVIGLQFDQGSGRSDPTRPGGRRRRRARRHALLQQADAGRPLSALQDHP